MSRLDRLVLLLDTGSSSFIRNTAADQLSETSKNHPEDTLNILARVYPFLKSNKWETRIAASRAFAGIVDNSSVWNPKENKETSDDHKMDIDSDSASNRKDGKVKTEPDTDTDEIDRKFQLADERIEMQIKKEQDVKDANGLDLMKVDPEKQIEQIQKVLSDSDNMKLDSIHFFNLISNDSAKLVASGTPLINLSDPTKSLTETLQLSKKILNARLGFGDPSILVKQEQEFKKMKLLKDQELELQKQKAELENQKRLQQNLSQQLENLDDTRKSKGSAARLRAMAKRRAKVAAANPGKSGNSNGSGSNNGSIDLSQSSLTGTAPTSESDNYKPSPGEASKFEITAQSDSNVLVMENVKVENIAFSDSNDTFWKFQGLYELLIIDLFNPNWEIRHGSALGLRALLKHHAKSINRIKGYSHQENDFRNLSALEDLCSKFLILFCLDKFGDYVGDSVVAPVRESSAQALAALLVNLDDTNQNDCNLLKKIFLKLIELVNQDFDAINTTNNKIMFSWEAAHGGILGLKYVVSIKSEFIFQNKEVFQSIIAIVLLGLDNNIEEIQSESAALLIPIIDHIIIHKEWLTRILKIVFDILDSISDDDLKSSLNNVLQLISTLAQYPQVLDIMHEMSVNENHDYTFENLIPKLYPFLRHSISTIRKAVLSSLLSFLQMKGVISETQLNSSRKWFQHPLLLRLMYQNLLLEQNEDILKMSEKVMIQLIHVNYQYDEFKYLRSNFNSHLSPILNLVLVPIGINRLNYEMNCEDVLKPNGEPISKKENHQTINDEENKNMEFGKRGRKRKQIKDDEKPDLFVNIDAPMLKGDIALLGEQIFIRTRLSAAKYFGIILAYFTTSDCLESVNVKLQKALTSPLSSPRIFSCVVFQNYFDQLTSFGIANDSLISKIDPVIMKYLNELDQLPLPFFRELVPSMKSLRNTCSELFHRFEEIGNIQRSKIPVLPVIVKGEKQAGSNAFGISDAEKVITVYYPKLIKMISGPSKFTMAESLENSKQVIVKSMETVQEFVTSRQITVMASYATTALKININKNCLPLKLNPYIRCLMESVKMERILLYQDVVCHAVKDLIVKLIDHKKVKVYEKIIKNLRSYLCVQFPEFASNKHMKSEIFSLEIQKSIAQLHNYDNLKLARVAGSKNVLCLLLREFGDDIFKQLPILRKLAFEPIYLLSKINEDALDDNQAQGIVDSIGLIETLAANLSAEVLLKDLKLECLLHALKSKFSIFRYSAAKCLATLCKTFSTKTVPFMVLHVLPMLKNSGDIQHRQGAIECIYHLSNMMGSDILPYVIFFIVPVLGRMNDSDSNIRILATTTFASIIKLVPLEEGIKDPDDMPVELLEGREKERNFLKELMNPKEIPDYELPVSIKATLRSYQKAGVNWLHFLNRYNLHGILCDDMGLGKTLQTICIVSSDHHDRMVKYEKSKLPEFQRLPSLVICPPSVMGHWEQEVNQYAPFLKVLVYSGSPALRTPLRFQFDTVDIIVTSYDVMRNDSEFISTKNFNYAVLDEGHIIKNSNSKLSKSVKAIKAEHRLILTGTPIQNNVLELWSLFDFLMPGFLGTEKYFQEKFSKPIAASRNAKVSSKEQEKGALALEALHKQVLPFMLRRLKSEVLSDLPPKIIQDRYCELSEIQKALYKDFVKKQQSSVEDDLKKAMDGESTTNDDLSENNSVGKQHIFQALQYMRKLCNHPSLVLSPSHPNYDQIQQYLKDTNSNIDDIRNAPKLMDLKNLLIECGIGVNGASSRHTSSREKEEQLLNDGVISQHRALIFCQLKEMLDKVENDLFKKHLQNVSYMRLDGTTDPRMRQQLVTKFNSDPSIDVLLLTTRVGGLGLNLTGADTVIFVEHDWNPMNDLQAMDRAHRLGQTKAVNVYRLVTRNTLEEKIMSLQQFKVNVASAVVSQQNNNLNSMDTNQLLDLFSVDDKETEAGSMKEADGSLNEPNGAPVDDLGLGGKAKKALGSLAEMWDNSQYEDEYNVRNFVDSLGKKK